jgi:hypothetical protein
MTCESIQQDLLKEQTEELSWLARKRIVRHLRGCAACRRFREETALVMELAASPGPGRNARPATMERIMQAAREEKSRSRVIQIQPARDSFLSRRHPALMVAASCILLAAGAWLFLRSHRSSAPNPELAHQEEPRTTQAVEQTAAVAELSWDSPIGLELAQLNTVLAAASSQDIFSEARTNDDTEPDLDAMIRELLELEGVQI